MGKDGSFGCVWQGRHWMGRWTMEGGTLWVEEWLPAQDEWTRSSQRHRWSARLKPGTLEGPLDGGGAFRLRKRSP